MEKVKNWNEKDYEEFTEEEIMQIRDEAEVREARLLQDQQNDNQKEIQTNGA